ncbi:MAG: hypothetical protein GEU93_06780 [Propionibacteriales bacterium]|nr:hypothetical protein [Propionibacteriales bacterium]
MRLEDAIRDFQLVPPIDPRVTEQRRMAERPTDLAGLRVGLLDNRKANANVLLTSIGGGLEERYGAGSTALFEKPVFSRPSPEHLLSELERFDAVVTALGD